MVLVDTNIWIHAFKNSKSSVVPALSRLAIEKHACITKIIRAELLSGVRNEVEYRFLEEKLLSVPVAEDKLDLWDQAAHARFRLARLGIQEGLIDLSIACSAFQNHMPLWTLDRQFPAIQKVVPFKFFHPDA